MSLFVQTSGNPEAQPLVLLHGWGMSSAIWKDWLAQLNQQFYVIQIDLPGLGQSSFEGQYYSLAAVAEQVAAALLPSLHRPTLWLGWSLGGVVAAQLAHANPQQTRGLITIATNPCFVARSDWPYAMPSTTFEAFQQSLAQAPAKTLNRFAMLQVQGDPQAREQLRLLKRLITDLPQQGVCLERSLALLAEDYRELFQGVNCPRLHLFGTEDSLVPAEVTQQPLLAGHSAVIEQAAHLPFLSATDAVSAKIDTWLEAQDG